MLTSVFVFCRSDCLLSAQFLGLPHLKKYSIVLPKCKALNCPKVEVLLDMDGIKKVLII